MPTRGHAAHEICVFHVPRGTCPRRHVFGEDHGIIPLFSKINMIAAGERLAEATANCLYSQRRSCYCARYTICVAVYRYSAAINGADLELSRYCLGVVFLVM